MSDICFQWRDTGTCRFGASCKFDHGGVAVAGPAPRPGGGPPEIRVETRGKGRKAGRKRSRSRERGRYGRRNRSRSRERRRGRSSSPDPFGRDVRRRPESIERERQEREELRHRREIERQQEIKRKKEREKERKRELRELTASARWDGEGPRPPGTDLSQYRHDKDMGYVAKNKCWIYTPGERNLWYQKRTGRYYVFDRASHAYVYSHGGVDPSAAAVAAADEAKQQIELAPPTPTVVTTIIEEPVADVPKKPAESEAPKIFGVSTESFAGRKDTLEDRFCQEEKIDDLGTFFGLFDGHGGFACAEYAAKRIPKNLATYWKRQRTGGNKEASLVAEAFSETFQSVDNEYLKLSKKKDAEDGSTAVCMLIVGDFSKDPSEPPPRLYTANLGDSRAILCRGGEAIELTRDHKPNDREEKKRIEGCGGKVVKMGTVWRVTKRDVTNRPAVKVFLSTSRSLGDRPLKVPDPLVSGVPDIKMLRISPRDYFAVLVCDGVTDVMSDQDIVDIVCDNLHNAEEAAKAVVKAAYNKKSKDNLTAMVVLFLQQLEGAEDAIKQYRTTRRAKEEVSRNATPGKDFSSNHTKPCESVCRNNFYSKWKKMINLPRVSLQI